MIVTVLPNRLNAGRVNQAAIHSALFLGEDGAPIDGGGAHGMCTTEKNKVNSDLLEFTKA
jgi:hypothetical protein